jgi:hypothetical protein
MCPYPPEVISSHGELGYRLVADIGAGAVTIF